MLLVIGSGMERSRLEVRWEQIKPAPFPIEYPSRRRVFHMRNPAAEHSPAAQPAPYKDIRQRQQRQRPRQRRAPHENRSSNHHRGGFAPSNCLPPDKAPGGINVQSGNTRRRHEYINSAQQK